MLSAMAIFALLISQSSVFLSAPTASAAVTNWQRGINIVPESTTDFGSANMQQSLRNLKATGANYVSLVVPYYQSNTKSSDLAAGWNTPTDAALTAAIDYAHSIGLAVALKVHAESYDGNWRAYISPSNRTTWFSAYNGILTHLGQIGQAHGVEMIVIGTELVSVASSKVNSNNTAQWQTLISNLRKIYTGKLTYDANSTNNNSDPFEDEKESIGFWGNLDYAGLSVYYNLNGDNSVASLSSQWAYWNNNDLKGFQQRVGKPLLFAEIGYRSADNAHSAPWDQPRGGYNATEQANAYEALLSYWNGYSYVAGIFWWDWSPNPNAGGEGNTGYTVQNKPAQTTLTKWFTNPSSPGTPGTPPAFTTNASVNPTTPQANGSAVITANITNSGATLQNGIVDIELYDAGGNKVFQQFYDKQTINSGESRSYSPNWNVGSAGTYRVTVGVFNGDWSQNYMWNNQAATVTVGGSTQPPPNNPPPTGTTTPPANNPPTTATTNIWWPSNGSVVTGVQPFKANLDGLDVSQYTMYWQVDGGTLNQMGDSSTDYPHKEADVDVSGWHWSANNQYTLTFVSKNSSGTVISQKSTTITVQ